MHYLADLQSVHGFRCDDNIAPNAKSQRVPGYSSVIKNLWFALTLDGRALLPYPHTEAVFAEADQESAAIAEKPRDALSAEILSTATQLYEKSHLKGLQ